MKRILLAVCGLSPQVITETLYALHREGRMPHAIRILTTREGKAACTAHLMDPEKGWLWQFFRDYQIDPATIDCGSRHLMVLTDEGGNELDDIIGEEESERFLMLCMEQTFELTRDPQTQLFFSIAGGRKTMGASLALAAQCYGRPQDRIFHVLVSPEFESSRDFFYPPPQSREIVLRDRQGQPYRKETRYAAITLVSLPFFSVRDRLTERMLKGPETPASLMLSLVRERRHELVIDLRERTVTWKGVQCDLMPAQLALYAFFAMVRKETSCERGNCRGCDGCHLAAVEVLNRQERVVELYRRICGGRCIEEMSNTGVVSLNAENFNSYRSKINRTLERAFGPAELARIGIGTKGRRPGVRYGLGLEGARIRVVM